MGITLEDLKKQLKDREDLKKQLESNYFQVVGQVQLLNQQIEELTKKESKSEQPG